jgi:ATP-dependent Lon protease
MAEKELPEKRRQLSKADWAEITTLYESGVVTSVEELAEQFDVNAQHLWREIKRRGIVKGSKSKELEEKAAKKVQETLVDVHAQKIKRVAETKDDHYKYANTLAKLMFSLIAKQVQGRLPINAVRDDIRTIKDAISGLAIARDERFRILGLDKDTDLGDEVPALIVTEMTEADLKAVRDRQKEELGLDIPDDEDIEEFLDTVSPTAQSSLPAALVSSVVREAVDDDLDDDEVIDDADGPSGSIS